MIHEIAEIEVISGQESAFETAVADAVMYFRTARGCSSFALKRSIESPQSYRLIVGWDNVDDHVVRFRESLNFQAWRNLVGRHFASPPRVEHVQSVLEGF